MRVLIKMKKDYLFSVMVIVIILLIPLKVYAGRGCCSWHGGQAYCDVNTGKWVCNDGTYSPSCTCSSHGSIYELTDTDTDTDTYYYNNNTNNDYNILELETKVKKLEEENQKLKDENNKYHNRTVLFSFALIGYIVFSYIIYRKVKDINEA